MVQTTTITPDQLKVGMYVHLDMKWFDHPFAFSHFKITSAEQIETIRSLGLKALRLSPELSDVALPTVLASLDAPNNTPALPVPPPEVTQEPSPAMLAR